MVPMKMKNLKSPEDFRNKFKRWEPDRSDGKLCRDFANSV